MGPINNNNTRLAYKRIWVRPFETKDSLNLFGDEARDDSLKNVLLKKRTEFPKSLTEGLLWRHQGDITNFNVNIKTPLRRENQNRPLIRHLNERMIELAKARGYPIPKHAMDDDDKKCTCQKGVNENTKNIVGEKCKSKICSCSTRNRIMEFKTTQPAGNVTIKAELNNQSQDIVIQADKMTLVMEEQDARKTGIDVFVRDAQGRIKLARTINVLESKSNKDGKKASGMIESNLALPLGDFNQQRSPTTSSSRSPSGTTDSTKDPKISEGSAPKTGILKKEPNAIAIAKEPSLNSSRKKSRKTKVIENEQVIPTSDALTDGLTNEINELDGIPKKIKSKGKKVYEKLKNKQENISKGEKTGQKQKEKRKEKKVLKDENVETTEGKEDGKKKRKNVGKGFNFLHFRQSGFTIIF